MRDEEMASCRFPGFRSIFHPSVQNLPTLQLIYHWDDKNIPPSLTQWAYQSSTHRLIDEVNYQFARRISDVASTGRPGQHVNGVTAIMITGTISVPMRSQNIK